MERVLPFVFLGILTWFGSGAVWLQGVTVGSNNPPDPSAVLDVQSSQQGILIPRMNTAQRNTISNPAIGLQIVNTETECIEVYFSGGWKQVKCNCTQPPAHPGVISGPSGFCVGQTGVIYSVLPVQDASHYTWTVPAGASIVSGQGTNQIVVNFGNTSGNVEVTAVNSCGSSPTSQLPVQLSVPDASFGPAGGSVNSPVTFLPQGGYISYAWSFQGGNIASSSSQNPQVTWTVAGNYTVSLIVVNTYGCSDTSVQQITISACTPFTRTFTNCGQTGRTGPSQTQCNNTYGSGVVNVVNGIQEWTVPSTGTYRITAAGGRGGDASGSPVQGNGAVMAADFQLNAGEVIRILVGQAGLDNTYSAGGGGGTFVTRSPYNTRQSILIIAGGGGASSADYSGLNGTTDTCGTFDTQSGPAQCSGNGGLSFVGNSGGGGGGFFMDGQAGAIGDGGKSYISGGLGGSSNSGREGGFGGGGGQNGTGTYAASAGGGYSGGNGGNRSPGRMGGGGGASYLHATATNVATSNGLYAGSSNFNGSIQNLNTYNAGHGYVTITRVCP